MKQQIGNRVSFLFLGALLVGPTLMGCPTTDKGTATPESAIVRSSVQEYVGEWNRQIPAEWASPGARQFVLLHHDWLAAVRGFVLLHERLPMSTGELEASGLLPFAPITLAETPYPYLNLQDTPGEEPGIRTRFTPNQVELRLQYETDPRLLDLSGILSAPLTITKESLLGDGDLLDASELIAHSSALSPAQETLIRGLENRFLEYMRHHGRFPSNLDSVMHDQGFMLSKAVERQAAVAITQQPVDLPLDLYLSIDADQNRISFYTPLPSGYIHVVTHQYSFDSAAGIVREEVDLNVSSPELVGLGDYEHFLGAAVEVSAANTVPDTEMAPRSK